MSKQFFDKTPILQTQREQEIQKKLWLILTDILQETYTSNIVAYLGVYGSQNYDLDTINSDIDCECFIFPTVDELIFAKPLRSTTINTKYGTCVIKDIRMMFNELRKSSPNIIECLATKYALINTDYEILIKSMLCDKIDMYARMSEYKVLRGLEGLYHKYTKDAMGNCKYYANALRIIGMMTEILDHRNDWNYTDLLIPKDRDYLYWVKTHDDFTQVFRKEYFDHMCADVEERLDLYFKYTDMTYIASIYEDLNDLQKRILTRYIKLNF